ncbi:MAG: hypothetical protein HC921_22300 [Synechococcaceae cyanobacterium SM2_3_1]|nr:hypothetical protein [Synechococcaceae cyanobacterium SM2_3_1]
MSDEELNDRFAQVADAIGRIADAQLGTQRQIGLISDLMIQLTQQVDSLVERVDTLAAGYKQQQAILNELIRQRLTNET